MPIPRFLFNSSIKNPRQAAINLLQRCRFGPSRRTQSCSYSKSTRHSSAKPGGHPIMPVEETRTSGSHVTPAAVAALGFVGLAAFLHYNDERRAIPKGQQYECGCIKGPSIGGSFALTDTEKRVFTEKDLLGNWVLLYFGYTSSPDIGPEQLQVLTNAINILESKEHTKVLPVFVTIDPQRDVPAHLSAYLKEFDPKIVGLTGHVSSVRQMAQQYRVPYKKIYEEGDDYLVESSHGMYLINPKMEVARCFGVEYNAEQLSEAIAKEVKKAGVEYNAEQLSEAIAKEVKKAEQLPEATAKEVKKAEQLSEATVK